MSVYDVTKHAVVTLSESLYYELMLQSAQVKVSVLCPGFVKTNILDSARNRPAHLQASVRQPSEVEQGLVELARRGIEGGMPPAQVAERVLQAIRDEQFYVFPHPEFLSFVRTRMEAILAEANPTLTLPGQMTQQVQSE
jgi:short-subunit dehydrogenase